MSNEEVQNKISKPWEEMTREERKVQIAKDVLARLDANKLIAKHDSWIKEKWDIKEFGLETELQEIIKGKTCTACAVGALFVCKIDRVNSLKLSDLNVNYDEQAFVSAADMEYYLDDCFSFEEIMLIESAFENGCGAYSGASRYFPTPRIIDEEDVLNAWFSPEQRIRILMKNIIDNEGVFNPDYKPWPNENTTPVQAVETNEPSASS